MAESLPLIPMVNAVIGKAVDALIQKVTRMYGVDGDRDKLKRLLLAVQDKLADAEVKSETNPAIKRWMKDLKAVAYEADDVLDDFQYEALRRDAEVGDDSTTGKVLSYFTPQSPLLFRVTMSRKLSNVLEKIDELVEEMIKFGLVERAEAPQPPYRQTHSVLDESADIFGRDHDKEVLVKLMLDQHDQQNLQVLPIVGMGGLGKTTLAKMIYNDPDVQEHFQLKMWHCVSENFEAISIVRSIIELATNGRCDLSDSIESLRKRLEGVISNKRFLLVLDDVWNEEEKLWEDDLKPLLKYGSAGSIIVVTTRSQRVASIMKTLQTYELACLSEDESWELFSRRAFGREIQEQADLVTAGKLIVKKCKGLPLALKTMGGMMSSKRQVKEWETIARSNIGDNDRGEHDILPILKLSYRHLPPEMKQCFAFCSVFPKDYEMDKEELIQLWMANGFIQEKETMDLEQKGENVFHNLVWRSFLQDVKSKSVFIVHKTYESIGCKMHDLMHDLAKDVADECVTSEQLIQREASSKNTRHLHISSTVFKMNQTLGFLKRSASLRTLIISSLQVQINELRLMPLRAFGATIYGELQVINPKHLRYLDLSSSYMSVLPNSICTMYNLQTLRLNGCVNLTYLPEGMRTMSKLIHLYLLECGKLERMPPNISLLKNLRTLTTFILDTEPGRGIEELKDLNHLANRLELYNLSKINSRENGKEANLHLKQNLSELALCWGEFSMPENKACNEEEVLESLKPHAKLKILELDGYSGLKIPQWMKDPQMLQCLTTLHISNCSGCKDLSTVWFLVSLEGLFLSKMENLTTLFMNVVGVKAGGYYIPRQIFPRLKDMQLHELSNLENWTENTVGDENTILITFPKLATLRISYCPKLASVPDCPVLKKLYSFRCCSLAMSSLAHLTTLSKLTFGQNDDVGMSLGSWPSLAKLDVSSSSNKMAILEVDTNQGPLENLRILSLHGLNCFTVASGLSKMHLGLWKCFAFVEDLCIGGCNDLVHWPMEELMSLIHLRSLSIEGCPNLVGKGSSSEEIMPLYHLKKLHIKWCHSLLDIPMLPASLEKLSIKLCRRLVALPLNLGNLARLKIISLKHCDDLKELPDGMDGPISLEKLKIIMCPEIEKFPQGLLHRIPTLQCLYVIGSPSLERRLSEGGEYFDLISSIPRRLPRATTEVTESTSNLKKLVKRLLPSCSLSK